MSASAEPGETWTVGFLDGAGARARAGEARIEGDALVLRLDDGTRLDFALGAITIAAEPTDTARGILVPLPGRAARIGFPASSLSAALRAHGAHRQGRRAAAWHDALRLLTFLLPGLAALALTFIVVIPLLAEPIAAAFPPQVERRFGDAVTRSLVVSLAGRPDGEACGGTPGRAALAALLDRLVAAAGTLPHPPVLHVVASDKVNAFALPGGQVLVMSALVDFVGSPDELAGVLAHELAHVAHGDPLRGMIRSVSFVALAGLVAGDPYMVASLAALGVRVLGVSHSRAAESLADARALRILAGAGISADGLAEFLARSETRPGAPQAGTVSYLDTHPPAAERARLARAAAAGGAQALSDDEWLALRRDCGRRGR